MIALYFVMSPSSLIGSHFLDSRVLVSKDLSKIKGFERVWKNRFVLFLKMFFVCYWMKVFPFIVSQYLLGFSNSFLFLIMLLCSSQWPIQGRDQGGPAPPLIVRPN